MNSQEPSYIEPTMFLFSDAKQLGQYVRFAVEISLQTRVYRTKSVTMYTVVGDLPSGRREVIAEFHAQGMAETFCQMATLAGQANGVPAAAIPDLQTAADREAAREAVTLTTIQSPYGDENSTVTLVSCIAMIVREMDKIETGTSHYTDSSEYLNLMVSRMVKPRDRALLDAALHEVFIGE